MLISNQDEHRNQVKKENFEYYCCFTWRIKVLTITKWEMQSIFWSLEHAFFVDNSTCSIHPSFDKNSGEKLNQITINKFVYHKLVLNISFVWIFFFRIPFFWIFFFWIFFFGIFFFWIFFLWIFFFWALWIDILLLNTKFYNRI